MATPLIIVPQEDAAQVRRLQVGTDTLLPENGTVQLPYEQVSFFNGFSPQELANFQARVDSLTLNANGTVNVTVAGLRELENPDATLLYATTDADYRNPWVYDPTDTSTADNTGLTLVSAGGKRYKRLVLDYVDVSWFGITPITGALTAAPDLSLVVQMLLPIMAQKYPGRYIRIPQGTYRWDNRVITHPYGTDIRCTDGKATLQMPPGSYQLLWCTRPSNFHGLVFSASTGAPILNEQGTASENPDDYNAFSLVEVSRTCVFTDCEFVNSRGHGCYMGGNVGFRTEYFPSGSDCSLSKFRDCKFAFNQGCGRYIDRDAGSYDANQIEFYNCDQRDNGLVGAWDGSFLGCQQVLGHYNNNVFGHQRITNPNNISWQQGVYEEDGSPSSVFLGRGSALGCRLTGSPQVDFFATTNFGSQFSGLRTGGLTLNYGGLGLTLQGGGQDAPILRLEHRGDNNQTALGWRNVNTNDVYAQVFASGNRLGTPGQPYFRDAWTDGFSYTRLFMGPRFNVAEYATDRQDPRLNNIVFITGDKILPLGDNGTQPEYYRCISGGTINLGGQPYSGVTVSVPIGNGGQPVTSVEPTMFAVGDHITLNGQTGRILSINQATRTLNTDAQFPADVSGLTVYTATAKFMAMGRGKGLKSQLPTALMRPEDAGWEYYATDENLFYYWNGTGFVPRP